MAENFDYVLLMLEKAVEYEPGYMRDFVQRLRAAHDAELCKPMPEEECITSKLRRSVREECCESMFGDGAPCDEVVIDSDLFDRLCDLADEKYGDLYRQYQRVHQKVLNQRRQLTEVQDAIHRRNEGELKTQWIKELNRLKNENAELKKGLTRGHLKLPVDMNGIPCLVGDRMIVRHGPYRDNRFTVVGIGKNDSLIAMNSKGEATMLKAIDCAHIVFSTTSDVIEDAMRWVRANDYGTSSCEWADMLSASAERIDAINEGRNQ